MGFIKKIGSWFGSAGGGDPAVNQALAVIEEALGPQLLELPDSRDKLEPAVASALEYYGRAIAAIPGPIDITPANYGSDPRLAAIFPAAEEIGLGLGRSMALRDALGWFVEHGYQQVHGLLGMRLRAAEGAAGSAVVADHTFRSLGIHDQDVREGLRESAFSTLIKSFAADLKERQREWRLQNTEQKIRHELRSRGEGGEGEPIDLHLARAGDQFTLGRMQESLIAWLQAPDQQLRIEAAEPSVFVPATAAGESPCHLPQLASADRRKWLVCLVRFPLLEAVNAVARESRPHRYILI